MKRNIEKSGFFGAKGWMIIIFTMLVYIISSIPIDSLNVSVMAFASTNNWDANRMLLFSGFGGFVGVLISLIFGMFVAKYKVKWPTLILLIVYALIWFFHGNVNSLLQYAVAAISIIAISNALNLVPTQQIMSNWFPKKKGLALGWATIGMPVSGALFVPLFQVMLDININIPFIIFGVFTLILAFITAKWLKSYPEEMGAYPDNEKLTKEEIEKNIKSLNEYKSEWTISRLLKNKEFWLIVIIFGSLFLGLVGTVSQLVPRLMVVGISQSQALLTLSITSILGIVGSVLWGLIDEKIGTKKTVVIYCAMWLFMMIISAFGSQLSSIPISIISVAFFAALIGGLGNLLPSLVIKTYGRYDFAQANKLVVPVVIGIRSFALIIVSIILGKSSLINIGYRNVFIVFTILSVIALIGSIIISDKTIGKTI